MMITPEMKQTWMQTYTGRKFYPFNPRVEDISINDIAHSLGYQCRFNGHTSRFYSVAEHSVLCARMVPTEAVMGALMHDAAEAYVSDMIRPLKAHFPLFKEVEDKIIEVISDKFDFDLTHPSIKLADDWIVHEEAKLLLDQDLLSEWDFPQPVFIPRIKPKFVFHQPNMAASRFYNAFVSIRLGDFDAL